MCIRDSQKTIHIGWYFQDSHRSWHNRHPLVLLWKQEESTLVSMECFPLNMEQTYHPCSYIHEKWKSPRYASAIPSYHYPHRIYQCSLEVPQPAGYRSI